MRQRRSLIVALAASFAAVTPAVSECVEFAQRQAFRAATVVFRGKVIKIEDLGAESANLGAGKVPYMLFSRSGMHMATFHVDKVWKGPVTDTIRVFAFARPAQGNGFQFRIGVEYVVYALGEVGREYEPLRRLSNGAPVYDVGECRLRVRTDLSHESQILGRGRAPEGVQPRTSP